jgi:hypothetical protein
MFWSFIAVGGLLILYLLVGVVTSLGVAYIDGSDEPSNLVVIFWPVVWIYMACVFVATWVTKIAWGIINRFIERRFK